MTAASPPDTAPAAAAPPPGTTIRHLVRTATTAALGTLDAEGAPYVSLVTIAAMQDATPLLLLSDLADHTRNFQRDPRASLLVDGTAGMASPLAGARATLMGRIAPAGDDPTALARYLARHGDARGYAGFADFNLHRLAVERAHLVAGFGRIHWIAADAVLWPAGDAASLAAAEAGILAHMNADHPDAIALYATALLGRPAADWRLAGIDPEGADLEAGRQRCRLWFDKPVRDAETARVELVRLAKRARREEQAGG